MSTVEKPEDFTPPANPYDLFREWLALAESKEINDPNAMSLATSTPDGKPSVRIVLLKGLDDDGLVFYTNGNSRKGSQIGHNAQVAVCFHWKSLLKQVRVEGTVEEVSDEEADAYYSSRHRGSRVGAWASKQSQPLGSYNELKKFVEEYETKFEGQTNIPRPPYWTGYRIKPDYFEFWIDGEYRLHQRHLYTPDGKGGWTTTMLYP
ncbi:MAG TPA: pyridoxamine 5'-phosphate oxidase [Alphaproteobacteria bacterium]|nr:pyridoxamine 5'-phosphate oxidase [Alphaproteobacteria bacterium]